MNLISTWGLYFLSFLFSLHTLWGIPCSEKLNHLVSVQERSFSEVYSELQKLNPRGSTKLALQSDFDDLINPEGGGACASTTAFNILQGLRLKAGESDLSPDQVLKEAFVAIPELLEGRVTNAQMTQLLKHFDKYFPHHSLTVSFERSPQSQKVGKEKLGRVWSKFEESQLQTSDDEVKMVVYQVHNKEGLLLGRHFVVLKKKLEGKQASVIDPNKPAKDFMYDFIEVPSADGKSVETKMVRPDRVPHGLGWVFTLDTIFSVKLKPTQN